MDASGVVAHFCQDAWIRRREPYMRILFPTMLLATNAAAATLEVKIDGLKDTRGRLHIAVIADEAAWNHTKAATAVRDIDLASAPLPPRIRLEGLEPGRYAVEVYQDVNANGKLDLNFMHIPKEPVGASRNPDVWRRPHFDECVFELSAEDMEIGIVLK
jgi:uncharacterized protein (DUF2141 family)